MVVHSQYADPRATISAFNLSVTLLWALPGRVSLRAVAALVLVQTLRVDVSWFLTL